MSSMRFHFGSWSPEQVYRIYHRIPDLAPSTARSDAAEGSALMDTTSASPAPPHASHSAHDTTLSSSSVSQSSPPSSVPSAAPPAGERPKEPPIAIAGPTVPRAAAAPDANAPSPSPTPASTPTPAPASTLSYAKAALKPEATLTPSSSSSSLKRWADVGGAQADAKGHKKPNGTPKAAKTAARPPPSPSAAPETFAPAPAPGLAPLSLRGDSEDGTPMDASPAPTGTATPLEPEPPSPPPSAASTPSHPARGLAVVPPPAPLPPPPILDSATLVEELGRAVGAQGALERFASRGMVNTGNTCFINATVQALLTIPGFCAIVRRLANTRGVLEGARSPVLAALGELGAALNQGGPAPGASAAPSPAALEPPQPSSSSARANGTDRTAPRGRPIYTLPPVNPQMLEVIVRRFRPSASEEDAAPRGAWASLVSASTRAAHPAAATEQEDAEEFLNHLLDLSHEELVKLGRGGAEAPPHVPAVQPEAENGGPSSPPPAGAEEPVDAWATVGAKGRAVVTRRTGGAAPSPGPSGQGPSSAEPAGPPSALRSLFCGTLKSVVKAPGHKPSATLQDFTMLQLDIRPAEVQTIEDALLHYTRAEEIEDFRPDGTSLSVTASKKVGVRDAPPALVLHVKRFDYDPEGEGMYKLHKVTRFDKTLRLRREFLADDSAFQRSGGCEYRLVATVTHHGKTPQGGHYTADGCQADGSWLRFDDTRVYSVPLKDVLSEQPYLLFYQREGAAPQQRGMVGQL